MKGLVAVMMALVWTLLSLGEASALGATVRITVDCRGNPETVTVANIGAEPLRVLEVFSEVFSGGDESTGRISDRITPGASITYESGPAASGPHVIDRSPVFEDGTGDDPQDGVWVKVVPEGVGEEVFNVHVKESTTFVFCEQRTRAYRVGTDTFKLTMYGTVPPKQSMGVQRSFTGRYGPYSHSITACADPKAGVPADGPVPACRGGGTVYAITLPRITEPPGGLQGVQWMRESYASCTLPARSDPDCRPREETFLRPKMSPDLHATYAAWYDFDTGTGGAGARPGVDQHGQTPEEMPDTGAGGLATGATIPVGNAAAGLAMLIGAGYAVLRQR